MINIQELYFIIVCFVTVIYLFVVYVIAEKGVPDFWLNALKNNDVLSEEVGCLCMMFLIYYVNIGAC